MRAPSHNVCRGASRSGPGGVVRVIFSRCSFEFMHSTAVTATAAKRSRGCSHNAESTRSATYKTYTDTHTRKRARAYESSASHQRAIILAKVELLLRASFAVYVARHPASVRSLLYTWLWCRRREPCTTLHAAVLLYDGEPLHTRAALPYGCMAIVCECV